MKQIYSSLFFPDTHLLHPSYWQVLSSRNVQLLPGYVVHRIRKGGGFETSHELTKVEALYDATEICSPENLVLELQPAERGLQSQIVEVDLVLWTVGTKPQLPLLEHNDNPNMLPLNARGQVETDETLRVKGHPRVFAVGDSCALRGKHGNLLPATAQVPISVLLSSAFLRGRKIQSILLGMCTVISLSSLILSFCLFSSQVALQQADFVGWNLWAAINGRPLLPFR